LTLHSSEGFVLPIPGNGHRAQKLKVESSLSGPYSYETRLGQLGISRFSALQHTLEFFQCTFTNLNKPSEKECKLLSLRAF